MLASETRSSRRLSLRHALCGSVAMLALWSADASAQDATEAQVADADTQVAAAPAARQVEEITVTARRREEDVLGLFLLEEV